MVLTPALPSTSSAASNSTANAVTLSLLSPATRSARSTNSGTASLIAWLVSTAAMVVSATLPHKPSLHSSTRSPGCINSGPAVSTTGLPGLPRQVKSTLRLKRSPIGTTCDSVSCNSL